MAKTKPIDYLWEIYKTFSDGKGHPFKYNLDLGLSGNNDFDISQTSKNLISGCHHIRQKTKTYILSAIFGTMKKRPTFFLDHFISKTTAAQCQKI